MWTEITRAKYERKGQRYASDVTDGEWALIEPQLPGKRLLGRPREVELRAGFNALLYLARTGWQWRQLPREFPPFTTVQHYFYAWRDGGVLEKTNFALLLQAREAAEREPSPSRGSSTANRSRPPRAAARAAMMRERRSKVASARSSPTRWACSSALKSILPMCRIAMAPPLSSAPSTTCFPGCAIYLLTAPTPVAGSTARSPSLATGRSKSLGAAPMSRALRCFPVAGLSNAHWRGSIETAWRKTSRPRSPAPRLGSTWHLFSSSLGG